MHYFTVKELTKLSEIRLKQDNLKLASIEFDSVNLLVAVAASTSPDVIQTGWATKNVSSSLDIQHIIILANTNMIGVTFLFYVEPST